MRAMWTAVSRPTQHTVPAADPPRQTDHAFRKRRTNLSNPNTYILTSRDGQADPLQLKGHKVLSVQDRNRRRLARLQGMADSGMGTRACEALRQVHQAGGFRPDLVVIRSGFSRLPQPQDMAVYSDRRVPDRHLRPPATRLMRSRGCSLQFFLTALFEAQCRTRPGAVVRPNTRPLKPQPRAADQASWVRLVGADADIARIISPGNRSINNFERRARQVRQALQTLAASDLQLVELADPGAARPYHRFRLMNEAGSRAIGGAVHYAVPVAGEPNLFSLDSHFFTNGWVTVLDDTELAFLCMVADMQARAGSSGPVPIDGQTRVGYYCLGTDGYQSHHLLERAGLLHVTRPGVRRPNGTFRAFSGGVDEIEGAPLKFGLEQGGFRRTALQTVMQALSLT
jgi:hypothetical protein